MNTVLLILFQLVNLLLVPLFLVGVINKTKAHMQMRIGSPVLQPFYDIAKLLRKSETISETASWVFIWAPRVGLVVALTVAVLIPWAGPVLPLWATPAGNFLLVLYLLAMSRFIAMLGALDTGSAFGGLGASREATISMLVEPTLVLSLGALALQSSSMDLQKIFTTVTNPMVAGLAGVALLLAALAELSRMPIDDPTTHLELTMVHEAMVLENSGPNLAMIEYAAALRTCAFLGLASQTFLREWIALDTLPLPIRYAVGLAGLLLVGALVAIFEGITVKLKWRSVPNLLIFATVSGFIAALIAVTQHQP